MADMKRATLKDAPTVLNINDRAMWVLGFNAAIEGPPEAQPWRPMDTTPLEGEFLAAIEITSAGDGRKWWEQHVLRMDGEVFAIDHDYHKGWDLEDYTGWQPLPPPPDSTRKLCESADGAQQKGGA